MIIMDILDYWIKEFETATDGDVLCNCTIIKWVGKLNAEYKEGKHPGVEKFPPISALAKHVEMRHRILTGNSIRKNSRECGC